MIHIPKGDLALCARRQHRSLHIRPSLSVVIPLLDEADNIEPLLERLFLVVEKLRMEAEIICVDDGSRDDTLYRLRAASDKDPRVKVLSFSRNFGKEVAIAAGLRYACGQAVVLMDGDLQHPPEMILKFVDLWRQGHQVVYGCRRGPGATSLARRLMVGLFYRLFAALAQTRVPDGACDFRLMDRRAVDALNSVCERTRFTKGLYSWIGFKQVGVPFDVEQRTRGRSGWTRFGLWRFAVDAITSFSTIPLKVWSYIGVLLTAGALLGAVYIGLIGSAQGPSTWNFSYLIVAMAFLAGIQLLALGIIGEYLGRVYTEVKGRPLYIIAEEIGFSDDCHSQDNLDEDRVSAASGLLAKE
jgi:glycosyltransferase involved in cell wall biosynthesis